MKIQVVGGGGREQALVWCLHRFGHQLLVTEANPGFEKLAEYYAGDAFEVALAERPELVVVGPEAPLAAGLVDRLEAEGIVVFGPSRAAAQLESSKIFTKRFCLKYGLPTAKSVVLEPGECLQGSWNAGGVVKLDGLAAGKGVVVCKGEEELRAAIAEFQHLRPQEPLLVEERLAGKEISVLAICDGKRASVLPAARDHKRRFDGDLGPNTGGMGAIAPVEAPPECAEILQAAVEGMFKEGTPFKGVLYGGFMLTDSGPKLLEFNTRFGDPECQPLMALLQEDPAPWFLGAACGQLPEGSPRFKAGFAACVVVCSKDYPAKSSPAPILSIPENTSDCLVFHSGTRLENGQLFASGGRVLGITGLGSSLEEALKAAYQGAKAVVFEGASYRSDIGRT